MQNKLYTIQFSPHPMINLQPVPEQRSWNPKLTDNANFAKFPERLNSQKSWNSWTREDLNSQKIEEPTPAPRPTSMPPGQPLCLN